MSETKSNDPTLQEKIIALYKEGADDVEVAASLNLDKQRFAQLYEENPGFKKIVDLGRTMSEAWWNHVGRRNLTTKGFQNAMWAFNMKNKFGWRDKLDLGENNDASPHDTKQIEAEIANTMNRIQKNAPHIARRIMEEGDAT